MWFLSCQGDLLTCEVSFCKNSSTAFLGLLLSVGIKVMKMLCFTFAYEDHVILLNNPLRDKLHSYTTKLFFPIILHLQMQSLPGLCSQATFSAPAIASSLVCWISFINLDKEIKTKKMFLKMQHKSFYFIR